LERVTEEAVLRIGKCGGRRTNFVRRRIVNDDGGVADGIVHLVVNERRDGHRHRREQYDESGKRRETSAPQGASHHD
jgi:hypothetical protein